MLSKALLGSAAAAVPAYIEDVFSTYLFSGNSSTQTITNGIDLSGKGGMVWFKSRSLASSHRLTDTVRGAGKSLLSNSTLAEQTSTGEGAVTSFSSTGFVTDVSGFNSTDTYVSWTFREQAKFFDVVTYTGNGSNRTIAHNLGSVPGCIIVKSTSNGSFSWRVYHRSLGNTKFLTLNTTAAEDTASTLWNNTTPTATEFTVGTGSSVNANGDTFVAYLFAHDAGGFGLTGTDNVISCGSYTGNGSTTGPIINLGWEPQWILLKPSTVVDNWNMYDNMRGATVSGSAALYANATNAEGGVAANVAINATGFQPISTNSGVNGNGQTYIYIAIRRGPMKTPTTGTSVFNPTATTATTGTVITTSFPVDAQIIQYRTPAGGSVLWQDRLRGVNTTATEGNNPVLTSNDTSAEQNTFSTTRYWDNTGYQISATLTGQNRIYWNFRRAPGFFDEVCYTGTGSATTFNHNLTVVPELMIVKRRSAAADWPVYHVAMGPTKYTFLDGSTELTGTMWNNTTPTSSVFSVDGSYYVNYAANTYVAYLFATVAGVSKVGSYTGTGALQTVNCGFTTGARFVLIHRIDSGSNRWYVWDSARGITSGNDPYLALNTTEAEVTGTNYVDTTAVGFQVTAAAPAALNASGGTYIFLAIA